MPSFEAGYKHPVAAILLLYDIAILAGAVVYYYALPLILNYPPDFIAITEKLGAPLYIVQYIIIFLSTSVFTDLVIYFMICPVKSGNGDEDLNLRNFKVWKKFLNMPFWNYIAVVNIGLLPPVAILEIIALTIGLPFSWMIKMIICIFSYFSIIGLIVLLFSKNFYTKIVLNVYRDGFENKIKNEFNLPVKNMIQIIPLFIVAVLFTSLLGYSRLITEKGDLLYRIYHNKLITAFRDKKFINIPLAENTLKSMELENPKDFYFILDPEKKIVLKNSGSGISKVLLIYATDLFTELKGHAYGDGEIQGAVIQLPGPGGKIWTAGFIYNAVSPVTVFYFLLCFIILLTLGVATLYYFSKSLSIEIMIITASLEAIAKGQDVDLEKTIPVTSNDEIGRLAGAFNLIQKREKGHINEIIEKNKMIVSQSRLAMMGEMLSNIAHQWRQPLNYMGLIIQSFQILYDKGKLDKKFIDEKVDSGMKALQFMSSTIDDFRNFFKPENEKVDFPIRKSIENVMNIIEQTLKNNNIELKLDIDEGARLKGYLNEYNQVILNLVSNAKDAILNKNVKNPWIKIRAFPEGGRIVLTVSDNAGGINDNIIDKIFDPYFTTKIDGTGIGLYMSKIIIENNMGGELTAKNLGEGAEFRISV